MKTTATCVLVILATLAVADAQVNTVTIDGDVTQVGDWDDEYCRTDDACDDLPNQRDAKYACIASNFATTDPLPADTLYFRFDFDDTGFSGANTGDGCWLVDTNNDTFSEWALCFSLTGNPATMSGTVLYSCANSDPDNCVGATVVPDTANCQVDNDATEGYACGSPPDASVECSLPAAEIGSPGLAILLASCTYPSGSPTSAPADCVADPSNPFIIDLTDGTNVPVELQSFRIE